MTKTLYLLRHAKSDQSATDAAALKDHLRPLSPRGLKAAERMESYLAAQRIAVDRVYCSTATRTRETFDLVREGLNNPSVSYRDKLYLAASDDLLAFVQSIPDAIKSAMLIGHNPGFHDLALTLTGRAGPGCAKALDRRAVCAVVQCKFLEKGRYGFGYADRLCAAEGHRQKRSRLAWQFAQQVLH